MAKTQEPLWYALQRLDREEAAKAAQRKAAQEAAKSTRSKK